MNIDELISKTEQTIKKLEKANKKWPDQTRAMKIEKKKAKLKALKASKK